jgi:enediyne biosynthesis protein E4
VGKIKLAMTRREFVRGLAALSSGTVHSRALPALHTSSAGAGIDSARPPEQYRGDGAPPPGQLYGDGQSVSAAGQSAESAIVFENTIKASKIDFLLKNSVSPQRYSIETMTGGVAVFDYNNDGFLDIFFTNGAEIPSLKKSNSSFHNKQYRNNRDGTFTELTAKAGLAGIG